MNKYLEYLDKRVVDQAYEIGVLRGTLKGILYQHESKFHPDTIKQIEEVLKRTDGISGEFEAYRGRGTGRT